MFKFILIIINLILLLGGALMLALGIALLVSLEKLLSFVSSMGLHFETFSDASCSFFNDVIQACGIIMIILGSIVAMIAFFGFCGACCDNNCLLTTYAVFLFIIIAAQFSFIIFTACYPQVFQNTGSEVLQKALKAGFKTDVKLETGAFVNGSDALSVAWMAIHFKFKCCGSVNLDDYSKFAWEQFSCSDPQCPPLASTTDKYVVPISCCRISKYFKGSLPTDLTAFENVAKCLKAKDKDATNSIGCFEATRKEVANFIDRNWHIAIGVAAGLAAVEIILILLSCYLCCSSKREAKLTYV